MLQDGIPPGGGREPRRDGNWGLESHLLVMPMALGGPEGCCDAGAWAVRCASRRRQEPSDAAMAGPDSEVRLAPGSWLGKVSHLSSALALSLFRKMHFPSLHRFMLPQVVVHHQDPFAARPLCIDPGFRWKLLLSEDAGIVPIHHEHKALLGPEAQIHRCDAKPCRSQGMLFPFFPPILLSAPAPQTQQETYRVTCSEASSWLSPPCPASLPALPTHPLPPRLRQLSA